ncbi:MAG: hypothetical protein ABH863_05070 [Candidatus Micrarchaeota archaeon]
MVGFGGSYFPLNPAPLFNMGLVKQIMAVKAEPERKPKIWVGVYHYHWDTGSSFGGTSFYQFHIARKPEDLPRGGNLPIYEGNKRFSLVSVKSLPPEISKRIASNWDMMDGKKVQKLGYVNYRWRGNLATSFEYFPKDLLEIKQIQMRHLGIGYFLEAITVRHLLKQKFTMIRSDECPETPRVNQLRKIGLEPGSKYPIRGWLQALGYGINLSIKRRN